MSHDKATLDHLRIDRSAVPPKEGWRRIGIVLVAVAAVAAGLYWWFQRPKPSSVRTAVAQAVANSGPRTLLNASGYVTARREATVSSKVTGKVIEVLVEEGKRVEAGQVLARLDATNVEASLRLAQAQRTASRQALAETEVNRDQAERDFRRLTRLATEQIASLSELDRGEAEFKALSARLERQRAEVGVAEQEVALWEQQRDDTIIRAPFSGIVTSKNAQPGEMISPISAGGGFTRTGICTIVDMGSLEIEVDVNESYINRVAAGQSVQATLDAYPDWQIPCKVIAIIPTADRQKATVKVRVGFDALDPRVLPDMGVKVAFQGKDEAPAGARLVTVPKAALRQQDGRDVVWVVQGDRAERRAVTLGPATGSEATISAGLSGGERVVIEGAETLADGSAVIETKR